jgi:hypothetical protein
LRIVICTAKLGNSDDRVRQARKEVERKIGSLAEGLPEGLEEPLYVFPIGNPPPNFLARAVVIQDPETD